MPSEPPAPASPGEARSADSIAEQAVRTIEEVRALLASATPDDLHERAAAVRAKLDTALGTLESVAREQAGPIVEGLAQGQQSIEREVASVEERIRENPLDAVLIAAGVGFVIGLLLRRGK
jgi:ElaB/YqjD/DUF883 family membrane-anchored ribosome-binding protein